MRGLYVLFQLAAQPDAVHSGHHQIGDDQVGEILRDGFAGFNPVARFQDLEVLGQLLGKKMAEIVIVFHKKDF